MKKSRLIVTLMLVALPVPSIAIPTRRMVLSFDYFKIRGGKNEKDDIVLERQKILCKRYSTKSRISHLNGYIGA